MECWAIRNLVEWDKHRRRNIYGRHLVGAALTKRLHALEAIAQELIQEWWSQDNPKDLIIDNERGIATLELGKTFANGSLSVLLQRCSGYRKMQGNNLPGGTMR